MQPFDLESSANRQQWGWLFDLPHRLNVVIEVVDPQYVPVFSAVSTAAAAVIRQMLTSVESSLRSAISTVMHSTAQRSMAVKVRSGVLRPGVDCVLVLARELAGGDSAAECRQDLELIGSWLTAAIEANFAKSPGAISAEPYRIASLGRILNEAGSPARLAMSSARLSRRSACGITFTFVVISPARASDSSSTCPDGHTRLLAYCRARRRCRSSRHPYASGCRAVCRPRIGFRVRRRAHPADPHRNRGRLAAHFSGTIDGPEQVRLTLYSDMLRESLNDVIAATKKRVVAAVTRKLLLKEPIEVATRQFLGN
jgi:hypothetical protein